MLGPLLLVLIRRKVCNEPLIIAHIPVKVCNEPTTITHLSRYPKTRTKLVKMTTQLS